MHDNPAGGGSAHHQLPEPPTQPSSMPPVDTSVPGFPPLSAYPPPLPADSGLYGGSPAYPPPPSQPLPYPPPAYGTAPLAPAAYAHAYPSAPLPPPLAPVPIYLPQPDPNGGMAVASLVLGIVSLVGFCSPGCTLPFAITGIVMGALGRRSPFKRTMASWGLGLSIAGLALAVALIALQVAQVFLFAIFSPAN